MKVILIGNLGRVVDPSYGTGVSHIPTRICSAIYKILRRTEIVNTPQSELIVTLSEIFAGKVVKQMSRYGEIEATEKQEPRAEGSPAPRNVWSQGPPGPARTTHLRH